MPLADRGPLRVMFIVTDMPVGGAETLLTELIRRMDRERFLPELCCLKRFDRLGEEMTREVPAFTGLISWKYDVTVLWRLVRLLRRRRIDAVVTVGAGDKMFWGRLAARLAGVPVICSALHSTGFPERVEFSNRLLAPLTDAFIAVAEPQGRYLAEHEGCPAGKIRVIPNGIDIERFCPGEPNRRLQDELNLDPHTPVAGIVAALRPEKNHAMFIEVASIVRQKLPTAQFLIVGDGPERANLESLVRSLGVADNVRFLGTRSDIPEVLSLMDVVLLTSQTEASPICLLEAMSSGKPVVATQVGSVGETVLPGLSGYLVSPNGTQSMADRVTELLGDRKRAAEMGEVGRDHVVAHWSVNRMVQGYENLIAEIYSAKAGAPMKPQVQMAKAT
jgi:glycosyltransferase involved in cell wall biosynthesis